MTTIRLSSKEQRKMEDHFHNDQEAHTLLAMIDAEFQSDPMSVQCFDLRIVERIRYCVALRKVHEKDIL